MLTLHVAWLSDCAFFADGRRSAAPTRRTDKPQAVVEEARPGDRSSPGDGPQRFVIGEGSTIGFVGSKVTGSHDGGFKTPSKARITLAGGDPDSGERRTMTIDTHLSVVGQRASLTGHLKSADFFEVETYPDRGRSPRPEITPARRGQYTITGNLNVARRDQEHLVPRRHRSPWTTGSGHRQGRVRR